MSEYSLPSEWKKSRFSNALPPFQTHNSSSAAHPKLPHSSSLTTSFTPFRPVISPAPPVSPTGQRLRRISALSSVVSVATLTAGVYMAVGMQTDEITAVLSVKVGLGVLMLVQVLLIIWSCVQITRLRKSHKSSFPYAALCFCECIFHLFPLLFVLDPAFPLDSYSNTTLPMLLFLQTYHILRSASWSTAFSSPRYHFYSRVFHFNASLPSVLRWVLHTQGWTTVIICTVYLTISGGVFQQTGSLVSDLEAAAYAMTRVQGNSVVSVVLAALGVALLASTYFVCRNALTFSRKENQFAATFLEKRKKQRISVVKIHHWWLENPNPAYKLPSQLHDFHPQNVSFPHKFRDLSDSVASFAHEIDFELSSLQSELKSVSTRIEKQSKSLFQSQYRVFVMCLKVGRCQNPAKVHSFDGKLHRKRRLFAITEESNECDSVQ